MHASQRKAPNGPYGKRLTKEQRRARRKRSHAENFADWLARQAEADDNGEPIDIGYDP